MKNNYTLLILLLFTFQLRSQVPGWAWARTTGGSEYDMGQAVATDASGNVYVTGTFNSSNITFGTVTLTNAGNSTPATPDVFLVKYDAGGTVLWALSVGSPDPEVVNGIAVDASGNIYICGYFVTSVTFGSTVLSNPGSGYKCFLAKYNTNGNLSWAVGAGGNGVDVAQSVAVSASGNVYIAGFFSGTSMSFGTLNLNNPGSAYAMFAAKYDNGGNALWANAAGGTNDDFANAVAVDGSGNSYVTGTFKSPSLVFGSATLVNNAVNNYDNMFLVKYDAGGSVLWAKSEGQDSTVCPYALVTDQAGNVYAGGYYYGSQVNLGAYTLNNNGWNDIFLLKYDAAGNISWAQGTGGYGKDEIAGLATDAAGNIYATGYFSDDSTGFGNTMLYNTGLNDPFVVKYNASGNVLWANSIKGTGDDDATSVATDNAGNIYVCGYAWGSPMVYGSDTLAYPGPSDMFIAKLSSTTGIPATPDNTIEALVYPNPVAGVLHVQLRENDHALLQLYNSSGTLITQKNAPGTKETLNLSLYNNGIYFIRITTSTSSLVRKIILEN